MVLVVIATLLGASLHAAMGFGFALVLAPALFAVFDPAEAISTLLLLGACLNLLILAGERRRLAVRRPELVGVLMAAVPGLVLGALVLYALDKSQLQVVVGVSVLGAGLFLARRRAPKRGEASAPLRAGVGLLCGALTTTTGTNGPPMVLMLERLGATPSELRDTMAAMLFSLNAGGALSLLVTDDKADLTDPGRLALLLTMTLLGHAAGRRIFERLDPRVFRLAGLALVCAAGIASVVAGVLG